MSRPANCYDNAFMESCFGTLKSELEMERYPNIVIARSEIETYIRYYNTRRIHSSLDYVAPLDQEVKRALKVETLRAPSAIEHRRRGYSLAGCVPAELASNSPGNLKCNTFSKSLNARVHSSKNPGGLGAGPNAVN
jgi:hypothetical protein